MLTMVLIGNPFDERAGYRNYVLSAFTDEIFAFGGERERKGERASAFRNIVENTTIVRHACDRDASIAPSADACGTNSGSLRKNKRKAGESDARAYYRMQYHFK